MHSEIRLRVVAFALLISTSVLVPRAAGDWPKWSGPYGDLTSVGNDAFPVQGFGLELVWSKPLGSGYSGITVLDGRLVTAFSDGESDFLVALDADSGEELWRYRIAETMKGHAGSDDGPLGTPTLSEDMAYGLGPWGHLFAVRIADGTEVWSIDIEEELGSSPPDYGYGSNPVVAGDVLVVEVGGDEGRAICGFDRRTGELLWSIGDDAVHYQSPAVLTVAGESQLVAITSSRILGLLPETGEVLWQHEHGFERGEGFAYPLLLEEDRILLTHWNEAALFRVECLEGTYAVHDVWRSRAFRDLSFPVYWEGHLYGYRQRFLTCVDAATGEKAWQSRPPGSGTLVLVDGHLVIQAQSGDLVIAAATPEGYQEEARLRTLEQGYFNPPCFAAERIFVRNRSQIAAVRIVAGGAAASVATIPEDELHGLIADLARRVEEASDKEAVIDEFMSAQERFPILEGDDLAHVVYRGEVDDLALNGNMYPMRHEETMLRLPGTDLFFKSLRLEPGAHFTYTFQIFEESIADPLNPLQFGSGDQTESLLAMPGWESPAHLEEPAGARGRIEEMTWTSEILENERPVRLYLPAGYESTQEHYPLLLVLDNSGPQPGDPVALTLGAMDRSLDNLIGRSVRPLVVAFVPVIWPEHSPKCVELAEALAEELVPRIGEAYRVSSLPEERGVIGTFSTAFAAVYAVFDQPGLFGRAAVQSYLHRDQRDELIARIEQGELLEVGFYVEWSRNDGVDLLRGRDIRVDSRQLAELLEARGYAVDAVEVGDGYGWSSWRSRTDRILETLFPLR